LCDILLDRRVISISVDQLKKTPLVVAAAGGEHKVESIVGASRGKLFNVLITDQFTANRLIKHFV
ncbi:MAG: sugar-binding domain-containing protein, partial [Eubacteriales bacterium]